ncbi:hypothetical protein SK128_012245 [Halocaridina rubra]|uniref:BAR domain-containing protein n=1 Tax=Halocaridina rubra TaxID=373956 RepID=A0AAN8ZZQ8_HALRR
MKSFLSLGIGKSTPTIEPPKPASGILPHQEEESLANLWVDITKAEAGCCKLSTEIKNYRNALKDVQDSEEKLIRDLSNSGLAVYSPQLHQALDEYLSVTLEMKPKTEETSGAVQLVLGDPIKQYHSLYEPLDSFRRRRDAQLIALQKSQDKLDRLKLKGKRTTDVLVERDAAQRQLKDINKQLLTESKKFHSLRQPFLQPCIQAYVQTQVDYYGTANSHFTSQVQASRGVHQIKDAEYESIIGDHLKKIKSLNIVAM